MKTHLEWGAEALKIPADAMVIVDCLSFTSAVSVACSRGARIYPYFFRNSAQAFAEKLGIECAGKRAQNGYSLSPASLQTLNNGQELVLPLPNGSTLSLVAPVEVVLAGALRNAKKIALYLNTSNFERVVFVAAGERWLSDGSLRPAFEDFVACGSIISLLEGEFSPEAQASVAAFVDIRHDVVGALLACQSGIELCEGGWRRDVLMASELSHDMCVPRLRSTNQTYREIGMGKADGLGETMLDRQVAYFDGL